MSETYSNAIVPIQDIQAEILLDKGYGANDRDDEAILQWLLAGYRTMCIKNPVFSIVSVWIEMDANLQISYPMDMVDYEMLSIPINGRLWTLTRDNKIISTRSLESCGVVSADSNNGEGVSTVEDSTLNDADYYNGFLQTATSYGLDGGQNFNYFKPDDTLRKFTFDNTSRTKVCLTYRTTGIVKNATTFVPVVAINALKAYVDFMLEKRKPDYTYNKLVSEETRFYSLCDEMISLTRGKVRLEELADALYKTYRQTPKR